MTNLVVNVHILYSKTLYYVFNAKTKIKFHIEAFVTKNALKELLLIIIFVKKNAHIHYTKLFLQIATIRLIVLKNVLKIVSTLEI